MKVFRTTEWLNADNQLEIHKLIKLTQEEMAGILNNSDTLTRIIQASGAPFSAMPQVSINRKTRTAMVAWVPNQEA